MPSPTGRALLDVLRQANRLEAAAVKRQRAVLMATRKDLLRAIGVADPSTFRALQFGQILTAVDREITRGRAEAVAAASQSARDAAGLGAKSVDVVLSAGVEPPAFAGVSQSLVQAVVDVTSDTVRAVWSELGTRLKTEVRRVSLGVTDPYDAMVALQKKIRDPKTFGSAEVRSEVIIRTEVNRTFSLANNDRLREADLRLEGKLLKWWLAAGDRRTRPSHLAAGRRYAPGSRPGPIAVAEYFEVGAGRLLFPLDPRGPAEEVIGCRCRVVPHTADVTEAVLEAWRAEICSVCAA